MRAVYSFILVMLVICLFSLTAWAEVGYTVKKGDTLGKIAQKFSVSIEELAKVNNLNPDTILSIDQQLLIPYSSDKDEPKTEIKPEKHTIIKGDCLDIIAKKYNCTIDELLKLNDLKRSSVLTIGQVILLPSDEKNKAETPKVINEEIPKDDAVVTDESKPRFKTEVSVEVKANLIKGKNLLDLSQFDDADISIVDPNKQEEISPDKPESEPEPVVITVINRKVPSTEPVKEQKPAVNPEPKSIQHVVKKGDTVSKIADKYHVAQSTIFDANGISKRTVLRVGQKLRIPMDGKVERRQDDKLISRNLSTRDLLVRKALEFKGLRYMYGGANLSSGVDCSGFTMKIYEKFGINLPHSSSAQSGMGKSVSRDALLPGDLIFFNCTGSHIDHVGIYIGNGQVIHASTSLRRIQVDSLSSDYFNRHYVSARRFL